MSGCIAVVTLLLLGTEQHLWSLRQPADPTTSPPTQVLRNPVSEELDESSSLTAAELRRRGFEPYNQQVSGLKSTGLEMSDGAMEGLMNQLQTASCLLELAPPPAVTGVRAPPHRAQCCRWMCGRWVCWPTS